MIIETKKTLANVLSHFRDATIGFVPTMGALHQGHLSLMQRCRENSIRVASIFVNPTQFNNKNDFENYPQSFDTDVEMLTSAGCDFIFAPSVEEMYAEEDNRVIYFGQLDKVMEGQYRPGHFNGVAQIICKLFDIVNPNKAYFGEKDFQQVAIIRHLVSKMNYQTEIVSCPIVREADGLAMSSRNILLTPQQRQSASIISRALFAAKEKTGTMPLAELKRWVIEQIDNTAEMKTEYFEIVDRNTLEAAVEYKKDSLQGCIAAYAGKVRLIDNIRL